LLTASEDGMLHRWDVESGRQVAQVRAHEGAVWSISVNPAEDTVASTGTDGAIRLWRLPELAPVPGFSALRPARPYEGMNITGATGFTTSQRDALVSLGAISDPAVP
jgi:WD40 repeat protein